MTSNDDHNETGCCACFRWLFSKRRRRAVPEDDDVLPEETLPIAEDTLGEPPGTEAEVDLSELLLEVEPPQPEAEVELPEPQLEVELPQPEAEVEISELLLEVENPQPEAEVELPEPQLEVELPQPEAEVELPEPQLEVEPPQPEAEVELPEPQLEVEPPQPRPEADTVRKCVRFHFENLPGFVKDRELYGDLTYCRYGVPLSVIRSLPHKAKQGSARPQEGPVKAPHGVHNTPHVFTAACSTNSSTHHRDKLQKSLPKQDRRPRNPGPRLVGYYLDSSFAPVKAFDQHKFYNGFYRGRYNDQGCYDGRHGGQDHNYRAHCSRCHSQGHNT